MPTMSARHFGSRHPFFKRVLLACALLAMAVKALIPAGFMLAPGQQDQLIAVVICTGNGSQTLYMDQDGELHDDGAGTNTKAPDPHEGDANNDHPCTFAGHSAVALAEFSPAKIDVHFTHLAMQAVAYVQDQVPGRGLAAPPPPATASPNLI
jgi:hypothetical protein